MPRGKFLMADGEKFVHSAFCDVATDICSGLESRKGYDMSSLLKKFSGCLEKYRIDGHKCTKQSLKLHMKSHFGETITVLPLPILLSYFLQKYPILFFGQMRPHPHPSSYPPPLLPPTPPLNVVSMTYFQSNSLTKLYGTQIDME